MLPFSEMRVQRIKLKIYDFISFLTVWPTVYVYLYMFMLKTSCYWKYDNIPVQKLKSVFSLSHSMAFCCSIGVCQCVVFFGNNF